MITHKLLILGATSAIAQAVAKRYAELHADICLAGRNVQHLEFIAADLRLRGKGKITCYAIDFNDASQHAALLNYADQQLHGIDSVLIAYGSLPDQTRCELSCTDTSQQLQTNFLSVVELLTLLANYFAPRHRGNIAVISSVAGDRGRRSNYIYGAAKGGLSIFLQGLRQRLWHDQVNVLTIKPGFVDTPMTRDFRKGVLWSSPDKVAEKIVQAISKKRAVVYVPFYWRYIMWVVRVMPEWVLRRVNV